MFYRLYCRTCSAVATLVDVFCFLNLSFRDWISACTVEIGGEINEPQREKTGLRGFRSGLTKTGQYSFRKRQEGFKKKRNCTIRVAKTKVLISFAVTAKLVCAFAFAYAKIRFSHDAAQIESIIGVQWRQENSNQRVHHSNRKQGQRVGIVSVSTEHQ